MILSYITSILEFIVIFEILLLTYCRKIYFFANSTGTNTTTAPLVSFPSPLMCNVSMVFLFTFLAPDWFNLLSHTFGMNFNYHLTYAL